jgi:lipoyl(octanoyl) transferase
VCSSDLHGPGQVVIYVLVDLKRRGYGVKELVNRMEQAVMDLLGQAGIDAGRQAGAPGVYVNGAKIAALGLRVRQGRAYHGLALNVEMDLTPFSHINPCGYPGLVVTQTSDLGLQQSTGDMGDQLSRRLAELIAQPRN